MFESLSAMARSTSLARRRWSRGKLSVGRGTQQSARVLCCFVSSCCSSSTTSSSTSTSSATDATAAAVPMLGLPAAAAAPMLSSLSKASARSRVPVPGIASSPDGRGRREEGLRSGHQRRNCGLIAPFGMDGMTDERVRWLHHSEA